MKFSTVSKGLVLVSCVFNRAAAFAPNDIRRSTARNINNINTPSQVFGGYAPVSTSAQSLLERSKSTYLNAQSNENDEEGFFTDLSINPVYAAPWAVFVIAATYTSMSEPSGASQVLIDNFIADPLHPGFGSSLFETVWNAIGVIALPYACLVMPGAKGQKLNPVPFLFLSSFAGYGSMGLFMSTRTPQPSIDKDDLGWFTKNVLENKIFNWALVAFFASAYWSSGAAVDLLTHPIGTLQEFKDMISGSALGTATTVDFLILCMTGASLIPEDLKRRGFDDDRKVKLIAASTLLVPALGLTVYSALRPSLDEE